MAVKATKVTKKTTKAKTAKSKAKKATSTEPKRPAGRPTKYATEEERKLARKHAMDRYRLRHGEAVGMGGGRLPAGIKREVVDVGTKIIRETYEVPLPKIKLTADSTVEDIRKWIVQVCENLSNCPQPAAWASAATIMQRNLELLIKLTPPPAPVREERPRITITLDDDE